MFESESQLLIGIIPAILMLMNNLNEERTGYSPNPFLLFFFLRLRKSSF